IEVATPEPAGLACESERPLQSRLLHPPWRLALAAREEVERRADADHHRLEPPPMPGHPPLLLRAAQAHEEDAGTRGEDLVDGALLLLRRGRPERRAERVGNLEPREAGHQAFRQLLQDFRRPPVE